MAHFFDHQPEEIALILDHNPSSRHELNRHCEMEYKCQFRPMRFHQPLTERDSKYLNFYSNEILSIDCIGSTQIVAWKPCWLPESSMINDHLLLGYQIQHNLIEDDNDDETESDMKHTDVQHNLIEDDNDDKTESDMPELVESSTPRGPKPSTPRGPFQVNSFPILDIDPAKHNDAQQPMDIDPGNNNELTVSSFPIVSLKVTLLE